MLGTMQEDRRKRWRRKDNEQILGAGGGLDWWDIGLSPFKTEVLYVQEEEETQDPPMNEKRHLGFFDH